ncbi:hypothetical protein [Rhizobium sp. BK602]|uniref:hypothetical protein n=1 Tax=Rhizobium sp. BK602 TaxID=2586986 RepID=UPI0016165D5E|nr:hypothetical protein [Rhizobium sp. BK602]MBB3612691.1 biotin carboxyl carrier protein [Rhizobium sp. BK602]
MMRRPKKQPTGMTAALTDPAVIGEILGWLEAAGVDAIEIETEGGPFIRIVAGASSPPAAAGAIADEPSPTRSAPPAVKAPVAGHFVAAHSGNDIVLAGEGTPVLPDQIVGFVTIGPMLVPVRVPESGILGKCGVETGALVGYGDTLFPVEAAQ